MHLFAASLDRFSTQSTRHSVIKLEDTLKMLIHKTRAGVDDMRKVWQFRLKRLLDKNALDAVKCDKDSQTCDSVVMAGRSDKEESSVGEFVDLKVIQPDSGALQIAEIKIPRYQNERSFVKDLRKDFGEVADRKTSYPITLNKPAQYLQPIPVSISPPDRSRVDFNLNNRRRPLYRSIQIDVPNANLNCSKPPLRQRPVSNQYDKSTEILKTESSHATDYERKSISFFDTSRDTGIMALHNHRSGTSPEIILSLKIRELEQSHLVSEHLNDLLDDINTFKVTHSQNQIFNPYIDFIYEQRDNGPNSNSLYRLKRLRLEQNFLDDCTFLGPLLQSLSNFHKKIDKCPRLACFVIKSLRTLVRFTQKTCVSLKHVYECISKMSKNRDLNTKIEVLNEEIGRLKAFHDTNREILDCYHRRAALKSKMIDQCSRHSSISSSIAIAMMIASDNAQVMAIDDKILARIEDLKARGDIVPVYKGLQMEDLIEIDLWEMHCLNRIRRKC